jgi:cyanate lyase
VSQKKSKKNIPNKMIAEASGTSESLVKKVFAGKRSQDTDAGQKVILAEMLLDEGQNKLMQEVKKLLNTNAAL